MKNVIITNVNSESTEHRFAFPIKIPKHFINYFSKEGDVVLDCFSGSGTTAMACIKTDRNFICIEKDKGYYDASLKRIEKENIKLKLAENNYSYSMMSSATAFWTKPYQISKKSTLSPGVFLMASPYMYNSKSGSTWNYNVMSLVGTGYSLRLSKRFGFNIDYKASISTTPGSPILSFFLVGSRLQL